MEKESVKKFDLEAAFKALDEIDIPQVKGIKANRVNLKERFAQKSATETLVEDYYDVSNTEDLEEAQEERDGEVAQAKLARIEKIVDLDAESPDDLLPSYVGKVIMQCPQCMTLFYKNPEDIEHSEENPDVVNINEVCQHCGNTSGYTLIGKVGAVSEDEASEYQAEEAPAEENELNLDFEEVPTEEEAPAEESEEDLDLDLNLEEPAEEETNESLNLSKEAPSDFETEHKSENLTLNEETETESLNKSEEAVSENETENASENNTLNEEVDKDLDKKLKAHNDYIAFIQAQIKETEEALKGAENDEIKDALQRRLDSLNVDLESALPDAVKGEPVIAQEESALADEVVEESSEEVSEEPTDEPVEENLTEETEKDDAEKARFDGIDWNPDCKVVLADNEEEVIFAGTKEECDKIIEKNKENEKVKAHGGLKIICSEVKESLNEELNPEDFEDNKVVELVTKIRDFQKKSGKSQAEAIDICCSDEDKALLRTAKLKDGRIVRLFMDESLNKSEAAPSENETENGSENTTLNENLNEEGNAKWNALSSKPKGELEKVKADPDWKATDKYVVFGTDAKGKVLVDKDVSGKPAEVKAARDDLLKDNEEVIDVYVTQYWRNIKTKEEKDVPLYGYMKSRKGHEHTFEDLNKKEQDELDKFVTNLPSDNKQPQPQKELSADEKELDKFVSGLKEDAEPNEAAKALDDYLKDEEPKQECLKEGDAPAEVEAKLDDVEAELQNESLTESSEIDAALDEYIRNLPEDLDLEECNKNLQEAPSKNDFNVSDAEFKKLVNSKTFNEDLPADSFVNELVNDIEHAGEDAGEEEKSEVEEALTEAENEDMKISSELETALEDALERGSHGETANVLINVKSGSGSIAKVTSWCKDHGLKVSMINANDPKLETAINGIIGADGQPLQSDLMQNLDNKTALIIGELDRASVKNRAALLKLMNDGPQLFTVSTINQNNEWDEPLDQAMMNRASTIVTEDFDEEPAEEEPKEDEEKEELPDVEFHTEEVKELAKEVAEEAAEKAVEIQAEEELDGETQDRVADLADEKVADAVEEKVEAENEPDVSEEPANDLEFDEDSIDDLDECSLNKHIDEYLKEVYSNVKCFEATDCKLHEGKLIVEGKISFNSGKEKLTMFEFLPNYCEGKLFFEGYNKDFSEDKAFTLNCSINESKTLITESFGYKYKINENLVEGLK